MSIFRCENCGEPVNPFSVSCPDCGASDFQLIVLTPDDIEAYMQAAQMYQMA